MKGSSSKQQVWENGNSEGTDSELRSGGMVVERREDGVGSTVPLIKIKVYHDSSQHDVTVPAQSTFRDLKGVIAPVTSLAPEEQRLLFRGKEKNDHERLHNAGIKDMSKVVLLEDPASRQRKIEQMQRDQGIVRACEAVAGVRHEVDKLVEKVNALQSSVHMGAKVEDQEFVSLTELLMTQLLKLDGIEAEGEARVQRRTEVRRIQHFVETLDALKAAPRNPIPDSSSSIETSTSTQGQALGSGMGSLTPPAANLSTKTTDEWERFE